MTGAFGAVSVYLIAMTEEFVYGYWVVAAYCKSLKYQVCVFELTACRKGRAIIEESDSR